MELLEQALRSVLFAIDQVAYGLIPSAYELIFYLANVDLFNNPVLKALISRVYLILGIFMLFKIAFSLIQYMIDPNTFSDKSKGFGKLVTNTLIAVVLLVMTPFIFEKAYELQGDIVLSNAIPRLILGNTSYVDYTDEKIKKSDLKEKQAEIHSMGVDVQFTLFSAFFTLNADDSVSGYTKCKPTDKNPLKNVLGSSDMVTTDCWNAVKDDLTSELHKHGGTLKGLFKYKPDSNTTSSKCVDGVCDERDFSTFGKLLWWSKAGGNSTFTIKYFPIISAIVGAYLLLLLISFSIDIAVRVFKLLFLQMIAPIAIISYMDPKESVGSGKFHNWLVECGKTYGSLFLRLAVIYSVIQLVRVILASVYGVGTDGSSLYYNGMTPAGTLNSFVYIFLILGVFTFAKKVPQMIEGIFGIKMSGDLSLNPLKSIKEAPVLGSAAAGLAGGAIGSIGGAWAGLKAGGEAGAAVRGGFVGGIRGFSGGVNEGLKPGMLGKIRSKTYKEMTGNDLKTFNPIQGMLKFGSDKKVKEVSDPLKNAKSQKSAYEERLLKAQAANKNADSLFAKHGVKAGDFIGADGATNTAAISAQRQEWAFKREEAKRKFEEAKARSGEAAHASLSKESEIYRLNRQIAGAANDASQAEQVQAWKKQLEQAQLDKLQADELFNAADKEKSDFEKQVKEYNDVVMALDGYEANRSEELRAKDMIKAVDKDIKTLEDEKKQREQFYGVEKSSKKDVSSAISNVSNRNS